MSVAPTLPPLKPTFQKRVLPTIPSKSEPQPPLSRMPATLTTPPRDIIESRTYALTSSSAPVVQTGGPPMIAPAPAKRPCLSKRPPPSGILSSIPVQGIGKHKPVLGPRLQSHAVIPSPFVPTAGGPSVRGSSAVQAYTPASHQTAQGVPTASLTPAFVQRAAMEGGGGEVHSSVQGAAAVKQAGKPRAKPRDPDAAEVRAKVAEKAAAGRLADLTIMEAKCWLREQKLPLKGKKEDLVARIKERLSQALQSH